MSTDAQPDQTPDIASNLSRIHRKITHHDTTAKGLQSRRWWIGLSLIVLGPLAVLVSTYQFVWDVKCAGGRALDVSEMCLLLAALVASYFRVGRGQHEKWIRERLCTEILRREYFICAAGVGPYLNPGVLSIRVEDRLNTIGSGTKDLVELIPMVTERGDQTWRDELEDARQRKLPQLLDLASAITHYLENRVEDQRNWFAEKSAKHAGRAALFENLVHGILVAAVALAAVHLVKTDFTLEQLKRLFFAGIALPMAGAALTGFQSLMEYERLGRSYSYHSARLEKFASHLRDLQSTVALEESKTPEVQFQFMRIVLGVEELLSDELLQWRLVMESRTPRAEA